MDAAARHAFADQWIAAWKGRDLESLLSHYAADIEFQSPLAARLLGDPAGTVRGTESLRAYFAKALAAFPGELDIVLLGVYQGVDSLLVLFEAKGRKGAEFMEFDGGTTVRRAVAHVQAV